MEEAKPLDSDFLPNTAEQVALFLAEYSSPDTRDRMRAELTKLIYLAVGEVAWHQLFERESEA